MKKSGNTPVRDPPALGGGADRAPSAALRDRLRFRGFAGVGEFDAARRALMVTRGQPISMADIEGVLRLAQVSVPLPEAEDEPDAAVRRLLAKAARRGPEPWLVESAALIQALIIFITTDNVTGICLTLDNLLRKGWRPLITDLHKRINAMLQSNVPPADLTVLGPGARELVERVTGMAFPKRQHRKK